MIVTRFPPEPNSILHLGHLKAMKFDFTYHPDSICYLRLDDTNPEAEKKEYVDSIIEDVEWLNFNIYKITHTSDYFDRLYDYAIELIKKDKAYVDFTSPIKMKEEREQGICNEYRSKPIEWNLNEFKKMKSGVYQEGECMLRLKIDMTSDIGSLRDPIAYRIKHVPHINVGEKWCIYPSYDYSHSIVDSLEGTTHSYCSVEFLDRRDLYYWTLKELGLREPNVTEFGRLNVEGGVLSKRKILDMVNRGVVDGFDDPRLFTIRALRRRGFTPTMLHKLLEYVNMDRNDSTISADLISHCLRNELAKTAKRFFAVIDPIECNVEGIKTEECKHPDLPSTDSAHLTTVSSHIYLERSDFRPVDDSNYYRLAPGKTIRLKYSDFVEYVSHTDNEINCKITVPTNPKKVKGIVHWLSRNDCVPAIFELYDGMNKEVKSGFVEPDAVKHDGSMQFERLGYFKLDRINDNGTPIFIRVVELKS